MCMQNASEASTVCMHDSLLLQKKIYYFCYNVMQETKKKLVALKGSYFVPCKTNQPSESFTNDESNYTNHYG